MLVSLGLARTMRRNATRRDERDDAMIDDGLSMFSHDARVGF